MNVPNVAEKFLAFFQTAASTTISGSFLPISVSVWYLLFFTAITCLGLTRLRLHFSTVIISVRSFLEMKTSVGTLAAISSKIASSMMNLPLRSIDILETSLVVTIIIATKMIRLRSKQFKLIMSEIRLTLFSCWLFTRAMLIVEFIGSIT